MKYSIFEERNSEIKKNQLLDGYKVRFKADYPEKIKQVGKIISELKSLGSKKPEIEFCSKRCKIESEGSGNQQPEYVMIAPPDKNDIKEVILISCDNDKETLEVQNYLFSTFVNRGSKDISLLIKLKKYLTIKKDLANRKEGIFGSAYYI